MENKIIWMAHPGHFICAWECKFRLNTYVHGYIISTVGEYDPPMKTYGRNKHNGFVPIGYNEAMKEMFYETMVFKAIKNDEDCCPYIADVVDESETMRYATYSEAYKGHMALIEKYSKE